jgi:hypothetical protein
MIEKAFPDPVESVDPETEWERVVDGFPLDPVMEWVCVALADIAPEVPECAGIEMLWVWVEFIVPSVVVVVSELEFKRAML